MVSLSYRTVRDLSSQQGGRQVDSYFMIAGNCAHMAAPDLYAGWSLSYRLQMLAFEAELAHLPRSLIAAIWEALGTLDSLDSQRQRELRSHRKASFAEVGRSR